MTLDPATRQQLIEARERIRAQLIDDDCAAQGSYGKGGPPDFRGVSTELKEELQQIDDLLRINPDKDEVESGDEDPKAEAAAAAALASDYESMPSVDAQANIIASRVVVDDATPWHLGRIVLIAAILGVGIALAVEFAR